MRYRLLANLRAIGLHAIAVALAAVLIILLLPTWWGPLVGHWLEVPPTPLPATSPAVTSGDVVAVLGGDTQIRAEQGVGLLKTILKTNPNAQLLITGDVPDQQIPEWRYAELARQYAVTQGIPARLITLLATNNTAEDAQKIADYVTTTGLHRLTVVTDWSHSRRAVCQIRQALGVYKVDVAASTLPLAYSPNDWWQSAYGKSAILLELSKSVYYAVHYQLPVWQCLPTDFNLGSFLAMLLAGGLLSLIIAVRLRAVQHDRYSVPDNWPRQPKPRHGGTGLIVATLSLFSLSYLLGSDLPLLIGIGYVALGSILAVLTWLNERHSMSSTTWVIMLLILAVLLVVIAGPITLVAIPYVGIVTIGILVGSGLCILWIACVTLTFTALDTAEGLIGTQTFFAGAGWTVLMLTQGQITLALLSGILVAASGGLLLLNAPPARILISKPGSAFCGFTLAVLPVLAFHQTQDARWFGVGIFLVAPFLFEAVLMLIDRVFKRSTRPTYRRLLDAGYPPVIVPTLYGLLAIVSGLCSLIYYAGTPGWSLLSIVLLVGALMSFTALIVVLSTVQERLRATLAAVA